MVSLVTRLAQSLVAAGVLIVSIGVAGGAISARGSTKTSNPDRNWISKCIARGNPDERRIALTFDDGPNPDTTPDILRILKKYNAKATFFCIGRRVKQYPELVKRLFDEGMEVGNHTYHHTNLTNLDKDTMYAEWNDCNTEIHKVLGVNAEVCRPPGGNANPEVIETVGELGMRTVYWSVNSIDYDTTTADKITNRVLHEIQPGGIVLMHDKVYNTLIALDDILYRLSQEGYSFVTASELKVGNDTDDRAFLPKTWIVKG